MLNEAAGKYQLTKTPPMPGKCVGCGNDATGTKEFIDTTFSLDFYGVIVICIDCIKEMASVVGMVDENLVNITRTQMEDVLAENIELGQKVEALDNVIRNYYTDANSQPQPIADTDSSEFYPDVASDKDEEPADPIPPKPVSIFGKSKS